MNNNIPFVYLYNNYPMTNNDIQNDFIKINNKIEILEKNINAINNKLIKLENKYMNEKIQEDNNINDMYII